MPSSRTALMIPPCLANVPRSVVRAIDLNDLLMKTVPLLKPPTNLGPVIALGSLEKYLDAARRQQQRIKRARKAIFERISSGRYQNNNLFSEVHFYLICWSRIAKLGWFIRDKTRFKHVGLVLRRFHSELQKRIDCRDHLEHFEERLPGSAKQTKLQVPSDLLNMMNEHVTYGGRKVDIGPESMKLLQTIVTELRAAILYDALDALAAANLDLLVELIQLTASDIQIARIIKATRNGRAFSRTAKRSMNQKA